LRIAQWLVIQSFSILEHARRIYLFKIAQSTTCRFAFILSQRRGAWQRVGTERFSHEPSGEIRWATPLL